MATLSTQVVTRASNGLTPTYAAVAGGGDACEVGPNVFLHFKNTDAATRTVTIVAPVLVEGGLALQSLTAVIPATTGDKMVGPITRFFANATTGLADITYSASANLTVAVVKVPTS